MYLARLYFFQSPRSNVIDPVKELLAAIVILFLVQMIETLVVLEDKLELVGFHWFAQALPNASIVDSLHHVSTVVRCDSHNHDSWVLRVEFNEALLFSQYFLRRLNPIHPRHVDVRQNYPVPDVTARFLHVRQIHVQHSLAIVCLVALESIVVL